MNNQVAQFIDQYAEADQLDVDEVESANDYFIDDDEQSTSWEEFCRLGDAWARHAQASNGFGGF
jgi:hypothetical protein